MSMTFSQWLSHSADAEFESFVRTRRDLLRPESPTIGALAAAASSRIGVSRGIEALDADELEVLISLATAARTTSEIAVGENPHIDQIGRASCRERVERSVGAGATRRTRARRTRH